MQQYKYDAYGGRTFVLDPALEQPYGFTGREYDGESGLYFYRARYYDPEVGRFITRDPIGFIGGDENLYAYVRDNPVTYLDAFGLAEFVGGNINDLSQPMQSAIPRIDAAVAKSMKEYSEAVVISTVGGVHNVGSKHDEGNAVDIRIWDSPHKVPKDFIYNNEDGYKTSEAVEKAVKEIRDSLSDDYQVVNERTKPVGQKIWGGPHIHIEYDPKRPGC